MVKMAEVKNIVNSLCGSPNPLLGSPRRPGQAYSEHFVSAFNIGATIFVMAPALREREEVAFP